MAQRLIDLDVLLNELKEEEPYNWTESDYENGEESGYNYAVGIVEIQSVVDPVKHGKWEREFEDFGFCLSCSECKEDYWFENDEDLSNYKLSYCPNCGARMDGE